MPTFHVNQEIYAAHKLRMLHLLLDQLAMYVLFFCFIMYDRKPRLEWWMQLSDSEVLWISFGYYFTYYTLFEWLLGKTPAKFLTMTRVIDEYGNKPSLMTTLVRTFCRLIPFEAFSFLGEWCRGWHDTFSHTFVVYDKELAQAKAAFAEAEI